MKPIVPPKQGSVHVLHLFSPYLIPYDRPCSEESILPELSNPVSSDKTAGSQDEVTSAGKVQELNVLLHLQKKKK